MSDRSSNPLRGLAALFCAMVLLGTLWLAGWKVWREYQYQVSVETLDFGQDISGNLYVSNATFSSQLGAVSLHCEHVVVQPDGSWKILASARCDSEESFDEISIDRVSLDVEGVPPFLCDVAYAKGPYLSPVDLLIQTAPMPERCRKVRVVYVVRLRRTRQGHRESFWGEGTLVAELPSELPTFELELE